MKRRPKESIMLGLVDPSFYRVVTPRLAGCLYVVSVGFIGAWTFTIILFIWGLTRWAGKGWWWFAPPIALGGLAGILAVRVLLEVAVSLVRGPSGLQPEPEDGRDSSSANGPNTPGPSPRPPVPSVPTRAASRAASRAAPPGYGTPPRSVPAPGPFPPPWLPDSLPWPPGQAPMQDGDR